MKNLGASKIGKSNSGKWHYRFGCLYEDLRSAHLELVLRHVDGPQNVLDAAPRVAVPPRPRLLREQRIPDNDNIKCNLDISVR